MGRQNIEPRLLDFLKRLFRRSAFQLAVLRWRSRLDFPDITGFPSNKAYLDWLEKRKFNFFYIQNARANLAQQFKLPFQYSQWVEAYLILGKKFRNFDFKVPFGIDFSRGWDRVGFSCALEFDRDVDCVSIQILPGASYREVTRFIHEHSREIKRFLHSYDGRVRPIRTKRSAERDAFIFKCFVEGILDRYGLISKTLDDLVIEKRLAKIDLDYRRKIIGEQLRLRK